ncbi:50S ribosomal protein L25/general stress protein Ctc [Thermophagus sp. OGC60D27]|uniref:50S ribosomal protein L25/general stress protein Ctc n=1 Tax=Thermophagus sp. OGC60D27 TaxID=3458415 RepID=UPI00403848AF
MQTIELKATKREDLGKTATRKLRKEGRVPCVIYGGKETIHVSALLKDFNKLIFTPKVHLVNLDVEGEKYDAIIQDVQFHPVSDNAIHVDFLQVFQDKPITIEIPVKLKGLAVGVKAGGKLTLEKRKLKVKALTKDIPDMLEIDVTNLGLGKSIQVGQLNFENIELLNTSNQVVASVKLTRAARAAGQTAEEA